MQAQGLSDAKQRLRAVIAQTDAAIAACNGAAPDHVCTEKASTDLPSLLGQAKPRAGKHKKDRGQISLLLPDPPTPAQLELFRGKIATDLASVSDLADQSQAALQVELLQHRAFETALRDAGR